MTTADALAHAITRLARGWVDGPWTYDCATRAGRFYALGEPIVYRIEERGSNLHVVVPQWSRSEPI